MLLHALGIHLHIANNQYDAASCTFTSSKKYYTVGNRQYDAFTWISDSLKKKKCMLQTGNIMLLHALGIHLYIANRQYDAASCTLALCLHHKNVCRWETGSMMLLSRFRFRREKNCMSQTGSMLLLHALWLQ